MTIIILQPNDARIGTLTNDGVYQWPATDSAGNDYVKPNDALHWLDASPRRDGTRRFIVVAPSMVGDWFGLAEPVGYEVKAVVADSDGKSESQTVGVWADVEPVVIDAQVVTIKPLEEKPAMKAKKAKK